MSQRPRRSAAKAAQAVIAQATARSGEDESSPPSTPDPLETSRTRGEKRPRSGSPLKAKAAPAATPSPAKRSKAEPATRRPRRAEAPAPAPAPAPAARADVSPPPRPKVVDIDEIEDELAGSGADDQLNIIISDVSSRKRNLPDRHSTSSLSTSSSSSSDSEDDASSLTAAGIDHVIELGKGTSGRCGQCAGCRRANCNECSACKRGESGSCIDTYCTEDERGRASRAAARELYMKSLGPRAENGAVQTAAKVVPASKPPAPVQSPPAAPATPAPAREPKESPAESQTKGSKKSAGGPARYVYGARSSAAKSRRCGECEGCMKDDCGDCVACLDKPRFGGKGTKKRACSERKCRMKAYPPGSTFDSPLPVLETTT